MKSYGRMISERDEIKRGLSVKEKLFYAEPEIRLLLYAVSVFLSNGYLDDKSYWEDPNEWVFD